MLESAQVVAVLTLEVVDPAVVVDKHTQLCLAVAECNLHVAVVVVVASLKLL